jgi:multidrug resistance efflux pump
MPDEPRRRIPGLGLLLALALLLLPIIGVGWWLNRPKGGGDSPGSALADLDVVCLGRVDGLTPVASLEPAVPGKVVELFVSEGQVVKAGEKLLRLDDESLKLKVEEARAAVTAADAEVEAAEFEKNRHPSRQATQEAAVTVAGDRLAAARKLYEEKKAARQFGTVTPAELIAAEAEVKQLEQLEGAEKSRLEEFKLTNPGLRVKAAEAKKTMAQVALKQAEKAVRDCVLTAPTGGVVLRVQASVGETIVPGGLQSPVIFRPDGPLVVRAELEQEFLGRVKPGLKVTIRDDARADSPTWTGTVLRVGNWVARKRSVLLEPGEINDVRTVECVVTLDGNTEGLLVGQRMRVRIGRPE